MSSQMVKVTGEIYRVIHYNGAHTEILADDISSPTEAVRTAMFLMMQDGVRGSFEVQRITKHEAYENPCSALTAIFGAQTEYVSGVMHIPSPASLAQDPSMSRYHPVNGWVIPSKLEIREDGSILEWFQP